MVRLTFDFVAFIAMSIIVLLVLMLRYLNAVHGLVGIGVLTLILLFVGIRWLTQAKSRKLKLGIFGVMLAPVIFFMYAFAFAALSTQPYVQPEFFTMMNIIGIALLALTVLLFHYIITLKRWGLIEEAVHQIQHDKKVITHKTQDHVELKLPGTAIERMDIFCQFDIIDGTLAYHTESIVNKRISGEVTLVKGEFTGEQKVAKALNGEKDLMKKIRQELIQIGHFHTLYVKPVDGKSLIRITVPVVVGGHATFDVTNRIAKILKKL